MQLRVIAQSRAVVILMVAVAVVVPALMLPRLPHIVWWPVFVGMIPWLVGKYVLCPLRWRAVTGAELPRWWHIRASAEAELLGLFTPGHVGADVWRIHRLNRRGLTGVESVASVALDRLVGAMGLAVFVAVFAARLPMRTMTLAMGLMCVAVIAVVVVRWRRPDLLSRHLWPSPKLLFHALVLSVSYQLTIAALLMGTALATGYQVSLLALCGALGASQLAGVMPGPNGASPRDAALVVALFALGMSWTAAAGAVTLKATVAWIPALALGGTSLIRTRRETPYNPESGPAALPAGADRPVVAPPRP